MTLVDQVQKSAAGFLQSVSLMNTGPQAPFKILISVTVDGEAKPLLLVGNVHSDYRDGFAVAVLNPDPDLLDLFQAGVGYGKWAIREFVAQRCDLALLVWIIGSDDETGSVRRCYRARSPQPAKFAIT